MVNKIAKTYSVKDGKITKTVTLSSTEESLSPQSPVSYSSNTPVKYGLINDAAGAVFGMIKETGLDKFCKYCDFMKTIGLASPTVKHTDAPVGYGFFDSKEMNQVLGCVEKIKDTGQSFFDYVKQVVDCIESRSSSPAVKYTTEKPLSSKSDIEKWFKDNEKEILKALEDESNWNRTTDHEGWLKDLLKGFGSRETHTSAPVKYDYNIVDEITNTFCRPYCSKAGDNYNHCFKSCQKIMEEKVMPCELKCDSQHKGCTSSCDQQSYDCFNSCYAELV